MAPTSPTPATWTVRFKLHKTTVLLHVDPFQTLASIKTELLNVLRETSRDGVVEGFEIPADDADIVLAKPVDVNDPERGWQRLTGGDALGASEDGGSRKAARGKGKGKGKAGATSEARGVDAECLGSLGIKDNAVLAFKFVDSTQEEADGDERRAGESGDDDESSLDIAEQGSEQMKATEEWNVVLPAWDTDLYGAENVAVSV